MDKKEILKKIDHTLLKQTATTDEIITLCKEGKENNVASVCIPSCYVKVSDEYLKGALPICTVIGFPNGNNSTLSKIFECKQAIKDGANEIDMVINIGKLKEKDYNYVGEEITKLAEICHENKAILKVIIETCLLQDEEIETMCHICEKANADYIKTSTGFSKEGANLHVVKIMIDTINKNNYKLKVKAAGGISNVEDAVKYIKLGVNRLGTSKLIKLLK